MFKIRLNLQACNLFTIYQTDCLYIKQAPYGNSLPSSWELRQLKAMSGFIVHLSSRSRWKEIPFGGTNMLALLQGNIYLGQYLNLSVTVLGLETRVKILGGVISPGKSRAVVTVTDTPFIN